MTLSRTAYGLSPKVRPRAVQSWLPSRRTKSLPPLTMLYAAVSPGSGSVDETPPTAATVCSSTV